MALGEPPRGRVTMLINAPPLDVYRAFVTEGFAIVLCDLKTLLETGASAGLTRAKAQLIEARRPSAQT